jgi:hypothetical protein
MPFCPKCGEVFREDDEHCMKCGYDLKQRLEEKESEMLSIPDEMEELKKKSTGLAGISLILIITVAVPMILKTKTSPLLDQVSSVLAIVCVVGSVYYNHRYNRLQKKIDELPSEGEETTSIESTEEDT